MVCISLETCSCFASSSDMLKRRLLKWLLVHPMSNTRAVPSWGFLRCSASGACAPITCKQSKQVSKHAWDMTRKIRINQHEQCVDYLFTEHAQPGWNSVVSCLNPTLPSPRMPSISVMLGLWTKWRPASALRGCSFGSVGSHPLDEHVMCETRVFLPETLPCSPSAESAFQPLMWCPICLPKSYYLEECYFHTPALSLPWVVCFVWGIY